MNAAVQFSFSLLRSVFVVCGVCVSRLNRMRWLFNTNICIIRFFITKWYGWQWNGIVGREHYTQFSSLHFFFLFLFRNLILLTVVLFVLCFSFFSIISISLVALVSSSSSPSSFLSYQATIEASPNTHKKNEKKTINTHEISGFFICVMCMTHWKWMRVTKHIHSYKPIVHLNLCAYKHKVALCGS